MIFLRFKNLLVIILLKNTQSYVSYLTKFWHFSILPNGEIFSFFIKFSRTCDSGIEVFCEMAKKAPKSEGIFLILPFVCDPSTCVNANMLYVLSLYKSKCITHYLRHMYVPNVMISCLDCQCLILLYT